MARNRPGGRRGAIRGRTQFRLPNGRYAKVDRTTGAILSIKADRTPYKGIVITDPPTPFPRRPGVRTGLPPLVARRQSHAERGTLVQLPVPELQTEAA